MLILCERCCRGVKTHERNVIICEIDNDSEEISCEWCDKSEYVMFNVDFTADIEVWI